MKKLQKVYVLLLTVMLCTSIFSGCTRNEEIAEVTVHEHDFTVTETREAACLETGFVRYTCGCGESYTEEAEALGHKEGAWEVTMEPTAKGPGLRQQLCTRCEAVLFSEPIPAETVEETVPDEKIETQPTDKMENKDSSFTPAPAPHRHSYTKTVQEKASCTRSGSLWYACKCGAGYAEAIPARGHDLYSRTQEGSCTADTVTEKVCEDCGRVISSAVTETAPGHRFGLLNDGWKQTEKPACAAPGREERICKTCGDVVEKRRLEPLGHDFEITEDRAPTCETEGVTVRTCKRCDAQLERRAAPLGHQWTAREIVKPTCDEGGCTLYICAHDSAHTQKAEEVPALGHADTSWRIAQDATCAAEGLEEEICGVCGKSLNTRPISRKDHIYQLSEHTAPSCLENGSDVFTCQGCGVSYSETLDATGHDYQVSEKKASTCTEAGFVRSICSRCGDTREETLALADHAYSLAEHKDATCTSDGYDRYTCACGDSYDEVISEISHDFQTVSHKDPTCTQEGYDRIQCAHCGETYEEAIPSLSHQYSITAHQDATCESDGSDTYTCGNCGDTYCETIGATGHSHQLVGDNGHIKTFTCPSCGNSYSEIYGEEHHFSETETVSPTCTSQGYVNYICDDCGETYTENLPALAHNEKTEVVKDATCDQEGLKVSTCTSCGQELSSEAIVRLPHTMKTEITRQPDCCSEGEEMTVCAVCGGEQATNAIPKLPHTEEVIVSREATCTQEGEKTVRCSVCFEVIGTEAIAKLPHNEVQEITQPTCEGAGSKTVLCAQCGEVISQLGIAALGHSYEKVSTTPASCEQDGEDHFQCSRCGDHYGVSIPKLNHNYIITETVNPSCTENGKILRTCAHCQDEQVETLPAISHAYQATIQAGTCTREEKTIYTCGNCGDTYEEITGGLGEHLFERTSCKAAACEENGEIVDTCCYCKEQKQEVLPATGHNRVMEEIVRATCLEEGYKTYVCTNCGQRSTETIPAAGHCPGEWKVVKEPTENEAGLRRRFCLNCEAVMDEELIDPVKPEESIDREFVIDLGSGQTTTVYGHLDYEMANEVFELLNQYRQEQGLHTLQHHDGLDVGTGIRAPELAVLFDHTRPNGTRCSTAVPNLRGSWGENIAKLYRSAESVMEGWKNSPDHNKNMLNENYNYGSIGVFAQRKDFSDGSVYYTYYFVQMFKG